MLDELSKRNFSAINQAFKDDRVKDSNRDEKIKHLEEQLSMLQQENAEIKQRLNTMFAKVMGGGATK